MPTLTKEENPAVICIEGSQQSSLPIKTRGYFWYVGCVKSRQEKSVARTLTELQHGCYCLPMEEYIANCANTRIKSFRLLFPGYIFLYLTDEQRANLPGPVKRAIFSYIPVQDEVLLRQDLQRIIKASKLLIFEDFGKAQPGQKVEFIAGAFEGWQATIINVFGPNNRKLLQLDIPVLGAARFEFDVEKHKGELRFV